MNCTLPKLLSLLLLSSLSFAAATAEPVVSSPSFLVADPSGKRIYVADETASQIIELDAEEGKILQKIPVPSRPTGLALSKAGDRLYVTSQGAEGDVFVIDLDAGRIATTLKAGHTAMAPVLSADESTLYVCNRFNDDVSVIDLESQRELARLKVVREPIAAALTSDGGILAVANHRGDDAATEPDVAAAVSLIDTRTRKLLANIRLHNGSVGVRGICISPDDRYVFASHIRARNHVPATHLDNGWLNTGGISVIDLGERKLFGSVILDDVGRGAANPWGLACTRDGKKLFVALAGTHEAVVIELPEMLKKLGEFNRTHSADQQPQPGKFGYVGKPYTSLTFLDGLRNGSNFGEKVRGTFS